MKGSSDFAHEVSTERRSERQRWTRESVGGIGRHSGSTPESLTRRIAELSDLMMRAGLELPEEALPISRFKASYAETLQRVKDGQPQLLTQGRSRFFVLSEEQVLQLLEASQARPTLSQALDTLPSAPQGELAPRSSQTPESLGQHRLPR